VIHKAAKHVTKKATRKKKHAARKTVAKKKIIRRTTRSNVTLTAVDDTPVLTPNTPYVTREVSLKDMGFRKGILLEGATVYHSRVFFFPAPMDSRISHGALRLLFRTSPNLNELANLRVSVNDIPYRQVNLSEVRGMNQMEVMLPSSAFQGNVVKVTVNAVLPVSDDRCLDDRLNDIFLHILPESALSVSYQPVEKSIRDAWRMLPQHVTLSLSQGQLSQEQFASALAIMAMLMDHGKKVRITRLPEIGDIIVAPHQSIDQISYPSQIKHDQGELMAGASSIPTGENNLSLVRFSTHPSIVLSEPYDVQPMYLLDDTWNMLAAADRYRVFQPDKLRAHSNLLGTNSDEDYYSLPLSKLGMNTDPKFLSREVSWEVDVNPFSLPLGTSPDFINLDIIAPVRWEKDPTYELYVFLNDVLVQSARLEDSGLKQRFIVNLPSEYQKQFNKIRVVVQHDIETGDCRGVVPNDYVQIMPDSGLVVKKDTGEAPEKFSDLSHYLQGGFNTYLNSDYLNRPETVLPMLARLAADFPLVIDHSRLHFISDGNALETDEPFVVIGRFALGDSIDAPLHFDRGRVKILAPNGESYFDVENMSGISVAEIVKSSSAYGLWVIPADSAGKQVEGRLDLSEDDVAFIDASGVLSTLSSSEPTLAQVYYPDTEDWFSVLGKYRFWLMVLLWLLLTMVVVYLYRMSRMNKQAREQDDADYQAEEARMQGDKAAHMHESHTLHSGDSLDHLNEKR